jgi:hypothetical protein
VIADRVLKTWVIVQWYFSGNDIAEHEPVDGCSAAA